MPDSVLTMLRALFLSSTPCDVHFCLSFYGAQGRLATYSRSQIWPLAEIVFQFSVCFPPNQGCLTWTYTSSGNLWKEFRDSMNLTGKKFVCLFLFTSNWNWKFLLIINTDDHRSILSICGLYHIKSTDFYKSQLCCCKYLKISFS